MMSNPKGALGEELDIYCRYCRLNLNGLIAALDQDKVAKVQCCTCRHFQDYRPPKSIQAQRERLLKKAHRLAEQRTGKTCTKPEKEDLSPAIVLRRVWDEATKEVHPLKVTIYSANKTFRQGDIFSHPQFGIGVVQEVSASNLTVLFRDGFQELDHGISAH